MARITIRGLGLGLLGGFLEQEVMASQLTRLKTHWILVSVAGCIDFEKKLKLVKQRSNYKNTNLNLNLVLIFYLSSQQSNFPRNFFFPIDTETPCILNAINITQR